MSYGHQLSSRILVATLFLLPIFFIPGGALPLDNAKVALALFGMLATSFVFVWELWQKPRLALPKHPFLIAAAVLPVVYLLSALLSTPVSLSLFGYSFEAGTFSYIFLGSAFLLLSSVIFSEGSRAIQALAALFASLSLVIIFSLIKALVGGDFLNMGNFFGNLSNPLGSWTDAGLAAALVAILAALIIGMLPLRPLAKIMVYLVFASSAALLALASFPAALGLALAGAVFLFIYFSRFEPRFSHERGQGSWNFFSQPAFLPLLLALVAGVLLFNPSISEERGKLREFITQTFAIENADVRPSLSATLGISKAVLSEAGLLGSGPNTFSRDWLIYKPSSVNTTPFWGIAFPFGAGFIPTQIASTGMLGTAAWLAFFILFVMLCVKALGNLPEARAERLSLLAAMLGSLMLWAGSFLYPPSWSLLLLAFAFSGIFAATLAENGVIAVKRLELRDTSERVFASTFLIAAFLLGAALVGWVGFERTAAAYHFRQASSLAQAGAPLAEVEDALLKAVEASPLDALYVALARVNFSEAQQAASASTAEGQASFQQSVADSIAAAQLSVRANPAGFENWVALGSVYSALVPPPLAVEGAYENARFALSEALKRNPGNPELYLMLAQLELNFNNAEAARSHIRNSLALKPDYADAHLALARLEIASGNAAAAIASAERLALLLPNSPGIYYELGILKYSNRDYAGAEAALNRALLLSPEYANARYYLGLTLWELGRKNEAQTELETLSRNNPENAELESALEAMRAGRSPAPKRP